MDVKRRVFRHAAWIAALVVCSAWATPRGASAHCDTLDGPVVTDARTALAKGNVTPALRWVREAQEQEIRDAFKRTMAARSQGKAAKDVADLYFFETLVRVHRAGEGAPYTGLKPAGSEVDPGILAADHALEAGSVDAVVTNTEQAIAKGIRERFERAMAAKKRADESVAAGREYVEAYVVFIHYVERLQLDASGSSHAHELHESEGAGGAPAAHSD